METVLSKPTEGRTTEEVAPGVTRVAHRIVNSYFVSDAVTGAWVLVDAGLPTSARRIKKAAANYFGRDGRPAAIILTHGHFDHVGSLKRLLDTWDVPVYAHALEMPFLTGQSDYPPPDPTVGGGMMSVLSRFFSRKAIDLGGRVQSLPADGSIPALSEWRWLHTPGHSPGHISLLRDSDHTLIAGDAFVTVKQESAMAVLTQIQAVNGPPKYFTIDWDAARKSVEALNAWEPQVAATGHGVPMSGPQLIEQLSALAADFDHLAVPMRGRYINEPAVTDDRGVVSVPPPIADPWPKVAGAGVLLIAMAGAISFLRRRRRRMH
jgi:glyoxylase-like metal-dependent hydrolase (beta-lactamase superfamily II)